MSSDPVQSRNSNPTTTMNNSLNEGADTDQDESTLDGNSTEAPQISLTSLPTQVPPKVVSWLGRGGMASVEVAIDEPFEREVALKRLRTDHEIDDDTKRLLVKEARITGQLQHPNIASVYSLASDADSCPYFTMQLIEGGNFYQWMTKTSRESGRSDRLQQGLEIILRVCDAVAYAHSQGVLHRDIKPENIMVGAHGRVYLMDWGIATEFGSRAPFADLTGVAGTPGYMAPEQARGEAADERADVFGLGAVLYEFLQGTPPYGLDPQGGHVASSKGLVIPLDPDISFLPQSLCAITNKATAPDREERYQSVEKLQADLRGFLMGGLHLPQRSFEPGDVIVEQDTQGASAFIIESGTCKVVQEQEGRHVELRTMGKGEIFGELALLLDGARTASVIASTPVTVHVVDKSALESDGILDGWTAVLLRALASRFREMERSSNKRL